MGGEVKISNCRCKDIKVELHLSLVDPLELFEVKHYRGSPRTNQSTSNLYN